MRLLALGLLSLFALLGDLSAAVRTKVDLVNLTPDVRAGEKALIGLRFRCDPHFHVYWKNPGDAGASPTIEWTEKSGTTVGGFIWPGPKLLDQAGIMNFVYEDETLVLLEVAIPAGKTGTVVLKGKAEWLECDDKGCWPYDKQVELTLKVGAQVFHAKFGQGRVKMIEGAGLDARAQIDFPRHGIKWLALSVAKLTPVP
jgi:thiol:disulfide interchange protein DsbD